MKRFTVHYMTPYCSWERVEAKSEKDAISKCNVPPEADLNDPGSFVAIEEEE